MYKVENNYLNIIKENITEPQRAILEEQLVIRFKITGKKTTYLTSMKSINQSTSSKKLKSGKSVYKYDI